jgi:hypothetical protein
MYPGLGRLIQDSTRSMHRGGTFITNLRRLDGIRLLVFSLLLVITVISGAHERAPTIEKIVKTYGVHAWDQIQAIPYTWNGEIRGLFKLSHAW